MHSERVPPTIPSQLNARVRAVVWECGEGQTDTDGRDQYTFRLGYASHEM